MYAYLPIAENSFNILILIGLGGAIGFLSGVFGVGGGFLMTPLLIFLGIPPTIAVGSEASQILASSVSGAMAHYKRRNIDMRMGGLLILSGLVGSTVGVYIFKWLQSLGQIDLTIRITYVALLGSIGTAMFIESLNALRKTRVRSRQKKHKHNFLHGLPFKMRFPQSHLYISVVPPIVVGVIVGGLSSIIGVGGGFILLPAMIYLLGMPTIVAIGTSLFQITFITANSTFFHASINQTVDIMLATLLLFGAVIGAQFGSKMSLLLRGEQLRALLALIVIFVCLSMLYSLLATPLSLYSIEMAS
ncbi:MAG: sulfite exporter TauE/SafE family protein [Alphaproteobacteria bacterium]|nr:sulfite exporter TauE/SafE family protein [Alphaproteobacteria bacterium]